MKLCVSSVVDAKPSWALHWKRNANVLYKYKKNAWTIPVAYLLCTWNIIQWSSSRGAYNKCKHLLTTSWASLGKNFSTTLWVKLFDSKCCWEVFPLCYIKIILQKAYKLAFLVRFGVSLILCIHPWMNSSVAWLWWECSQIARLSARRS